MNKLSSCELIRLFINHFHLPILPVSFVLSCALVRTLGQSVRHNNLSPRRKKSEGKKEENTSINHFILSSSFVSSMN